MTDGRKLIFLLPALMAILPVMTWAQDALEKVAFRVKYIAEGVVYLDGGSAAGLKEGQKLIIERAVAKPAADAPISLPPPSGLVATLKVISVAASSAVCEIVTSTEPVELGDEARLAPEIVGRGKGTRTARTPDRRTRVPATHHVHGGRSGG